MVTHQKGKNPLGKGGENMNTENLGGEIAQALEKDGWSFTDPAKVQEIIAVVVEAADCLTQGKKPLDRRDVADISPLPEVVSALNALISPYGKQPFGREIVIPIANAVIRGYEMEEWLKEKAAAAQEEAARVAAMTPLEYFIENLPLSPQPKQKYVPSYVPPHSHPHVKHDGGVPGLTGMKGGRRR